MGQTNSRNVEVEIRVSPTLTIIGVAVFGAVVGIVADVLSLTNRAQAFALFTYSLASVALFLNRWKPRLGRWFIIVAVVATIQVLASWLHVSGAQALLVIPTVLAAGLVGFAAAVAFP